MFDDHLQMILARLGLATFLGMALGFEREWRGHEAGLRTHGLVALSSAMITLSAILMAAEHSEQSDPVRVIQGLAQAIGFIAGGLIFVRRGDVRNMTTATSLWMAAAIGIAAGAGQYQLVLSGAIMSILLLTALGFLKRFMPRREEKSTSKAEADDAPTRPPNRRGMLPEE